MKFGPKYYWKPTPKNLRKWGDTWAVFWTTISASSMVTGRYPALALVALILALLGKAFSNFFTSNTNANK